MFESDLARGVIEVICGPMFSGKTEELLRRLRRAEIAKQKIVVFKPAIDNRYSETDICSHVGHSYSAIVIQKSSQILNKISPEIQVVAIDEVQFFDEDLIEVVTLLANKGIRVLCAGLDQDHRGAPFGPMAPLLAISDKVDKLYAVCTMCGGPATKSLRINTDKRQRVLVGEMDYYEARCRLHHIKRTKDEELSYRENLFSEK